MAGAAQLIGPHVRLQALFVLALVAIRAVGRRVLAIELPAGEVMVKCLLPPGDEFPTHQIESATFVLDVARFALLAFDQIRGVEPLFGSDPRAQIIVIVAVEALLLGQRL